jgi:hypothetical protein
MVLPAVCGKGASLHVFQLGLAGVLLALLMPGCSAGVAESSLPSLPSNHGGSSSYGAQPSLGPAGTVAPRTGLTLRPDVLTIPFSLKIDDDPNALDRLRKRVEELQTRLRAATGGAGEARVTGLSRVTADPSKAEAKAAIRIDGCLEIPLAEALDYWARAKLALAVAQAIDGMRSMDDRSEQPIASFFDEPRAGIKQPERYREELTRSWVERMRKFAVLAQSDAAPLEIVECAPPSEILEARISLEEVVLDFKPSCKLDVVAHARESSKEP